MSVIGGLVIGEVLKRVLQRAAQPSVDQVSPSVGQVTTPSIDPAELSALLEALQRPPVPVPEVKLPRSAAVVASIVIIGFFALLAAIAGLLVFGHGEFGAALAVLCVGFGVCSSKFGTVVDYLYGSSWGSRQKDAYRPQEAPGSTIVLPGPVTPAAPLPQLPALPSPPIAPPTEIPAEPSVPGPDEDARFLACAQIIDKWEGGYSNDPEDAGGPTNHGITQAVLSEWIGRAASIADVKAMSLDTAHQIFRAKYWNPLKCGELPAGLALMTYNCGVNSGISRGAKFLQRTVGTVEDGAVGDETIKAAKLADQTKAVQAYSATYEAFYRSLSNFPTFGRGWLNRLRDVTAASLALAHAGATAAPTRGSPGATAAPAPDLAGKIVAAMERKGYALDRKPGEVNIVYVEGLSEDGTINDDAPDKWNDLRAVLGFDGDKPVVLGKWEATTEPGRYYTDAPVNPAGAARIEFGQYTAWRVGIHRGHHEALVQRASLTVARDANKDMFRTGDARDTGDSFGINQHHGYDQSEDSVGKSSAGCLVGRTKAGHLAFMSIVKSDPRFVADPDYMFKTAILKESDVVSS